MGQAADTNWRIRTWYMIYCTWTGCSIFALITACRSVSINSNTKWMSMSLRARMTFNSCITFSWEENSCDGCQHSQGDTHWCETKVCLYITSLTPQVLMCLCVCTVSKFCSPVETWSLCMCAGRLWHSWRHQRSSSMQQFRQSYGQCFSTQYHKPARDIKAYSTCKVARYLASWYGLAMY